MAKVDTNDPNVRRLVYNMYRGILGNYNNKANEIVNTLPKHRVTQDKGIENQLESMMRQSSQISGGGGSSPSPGPPPGGPPPPPPPYSTGAIPSVRIPTEMSGRKEPPAAIQNAMMTKDKKPFTYTPGGLDLAEIRSPRMAKRISRNAHLEDRYDQHDGAQIYHQQMPMMQHQMPQSPNQQFHMMQHQIPQMSPQQMPTMLQHQRPHTPNQQMPPMVHQVQVGSPTPRGWSQVSSPPVQSRSFRVLQKITGSDQEAFGENAKSDGEVLFLVNRVQQKKEAPVYTEMKSPPVYTMPPSYPPPYYNMRTPTYETNAGQQDSGGSGNYWVWDANNQTYVPSVYPSNDPSTQHSNQTSPYPGSDPNWQWDGSTDSRGQTPYDYWNYPPQNEEEQRQFWEHYGQMCAYLAQLNAAACRYSPYPFPPLPYPSDSEECGYSSNDEMTYYGQMFKQRAQNYKQDNRPNSAPYSSNSTPAHSESTCKASDDDTEERNEDSDSSDTETGNIEMDSSNKISPDVSEASDDETSRSCTEIPHQLSVIFEEIEPQSEADNKLSLQQSDDEDSSATLENESRKTSADNTSSDTESSVVRVRLPLKLKFCQTVNDGQVATVIVGDSEVESSPDVRSEDVWSPIPEVVRVSPTTNSSWNVTQSEPEDSSPSPDVTITINLSKNKNTTSKTENTKHPAQFSVNTKGETSCESPVDFWKEMGDPSDEDMSKRQSSLNTWDLSSSETSIQTVKRAYSQEDGSSDDEDIESQSSTEDHEVKTCREKTPSPSLCSSDEKVSCDPNNDGPDDSFSDDGSESDSDISDRSHDSTDNLPAQNSLKCDSIRRNMDLLMFKESIDNDKSREGDESDNDETSDSDSSCANLSASLDRNNEDGVSERVNERSVEESEEDDSGVTSDLSRHISETDTDAECGSELSKMTKYQRAATHSRLFKLLQDECNDNESDDNSSVTKRELLTLPLTGNASKSNLSSDQESSSSGINSPMSPAVNERLVKELVQSLLSRKKSRHFRKLPLEKLYAAATRILQEDMDYDTGSTSDDSNMFLSPCDNSRVQQPSGYELPNPENYGENYYNYCDYYSSWADAAYYSTEPSYDILPSNTFRKLRDKTDSDRNRRDFTVPVRCPKVSLPKSSSQQSKPNTTPPET